LLPAPAGGGEREEEQKEWSREVLPAKKQKKRQGEDKAEGENEGERGLEFPKDLCVIFENCRDLFVKQNFPLI
jgi:hypothetical protein